MGNNIDLLLGYPSDGRRNSIQRALQGNRVRKQSKETRGPEARENRQVVSKSKAHTQRTILEDYNDVVFVRLLHTYSHTPQFVTVTSLGFSGPRIVYTVENTIMHIL